MTRRERDLRRLARQHGCSLTRAGNSHWRLHHPSGITLIAAATPSDHRARRNLVGALRRAARQPTEKDQDR